MKLTILLCILFLLPVKEYFQAHLSIYQINGFAQGTTYRVSYYAKAQLIDKREIDYTLDQLDSSLSIYKPYSLISRFNRSDKAVELDHHLRQVVLKSQEISKATNGSFDITIYPAVSAWGFGTEAVQITPDSAELERIKSCIGSENIYIQANKLYKTRPCIKIDVNGIAQGYSVDVVAGLLEAKGIDSYLVEIGGEIRVKGRKPNGEFRKVGIEAPDKNSHQVQRVVELRHRAITTSGGYRNYVTKGTQRLSHVIDPKTGSPVKNELLSVSVIAKDAISADGYDNAFMVMGLEKAFGYLKHHPDLQAYFIYKKPDGVVLDSATVGFFEYAH